MRWKFKLKKKQPKPLYRSLKQRKFKYQDFCRETLCLVGAAEETLPAPGVLHTEAAVPPALHPEGLLEQRGIAGPRLEESWLCYKQQLCLEHRDQETWFRKENREQKSKKHVKDSQKKGIKK